MFQLTESDEKSVPKNRISNVSIIFGFRFLPELNNLTIPKTWVSKILTSYFHGSPLSMYYKIVIYYLHRSPTFHCTTLENITRVQ